MSKIFEIYFEDLTQAAQQRYKDIAGDEINELIPIATIIYEVQEVE